MKSITVHPAAAREYRKAVDWYRNRSFAVAVRFYEAVDQALSKIAENAASGIKFRTHYRWLKVKDFPYLVYFRPVTEHHAYVIAIAHERRTLGYWMRRKIR